MRSGRDPTANANRRLAWPISALVAVRSVLRSYVLIGDFTTLSLKADS